MPSYIVWFNEHTTVFPFAKALRNDKQVADHEGNGACLKTFQHAVVWENIEMAASNVVIHRLAQTRKHYRQLGTFNKALNAPL